MHKLYCEQQSGKEVVCENQRPQQRYNARLHISAAKKKDLLDLCKREFHGYYESLNTGKDVNDRLPYPGVTESDQEDE